jgi:hypothetical protein
LLRGTTTHTTPVQLPHGSSDQVKDALKDRRGLAAGSRVKANLIASPHAALWCGGGSGPGDTWLLGQGAAASYRSAIFIRGYQTIPYRPPHNHSSPSDTDLLLNTVKMGPYCPDRYKQINRDSGV